MHILYLWNKGLQLFLDMVHSFSTDVTRATAQTTLLNYMRRYIGNWGEKNPFSKDVSWHSWVLIFQPSLCPAGLLCAPCSFRVHFAAVHSDSGSLGPDLTTPEEVGKTSNVFYSHYAGKFLAWYNHRSFGFVFKEKSAREIIRLS